MMPCGGLLRGAMICLAVLAGSVGATSRAEDAAAPAAVADEWLRVAAQAREQERRSIEADPAVVRSYDFREGEGRLAGNRAGDRSGTLLLSSTATWEGAGAQALSGGTPSSAMFPEWGLGRWPGKSALRLGRGAGQVFRSRFYGVGQSAFTVVAWVYVPALEGAAATQAQMDGGNEGGALLALGPGWGSGWKLSAEWRRWCKDGRVEFRFGLPKNVAITSLQPFRRGVWHQVAAAWDGKQIRLTVDEQESSVPCAGPFVPAGDAPAQVEEDIGGLRIGGAEEGRRPEPGVRFLLDELTIWKRALPTEELRQNWQLYQSAVPLARQALLQQQAAARAQQAAAIVLGGVSERYVPVGVPVPLRVESAAGDAAADGDVVSCRVWRADDHTVVLDQQQLLRQGKSGCDWVPDRCGLYRVRLEVRDKAAVPLLVRDVTMAAIRGAEGAWADNAGRDAMELGVQPERGRTAESGVLGVRWLRVVVDWSRLEPQKGLYDWREADRRVIGTAGNRSVLLCLTGWPKWLVRDGAALPDDWVAYRNVLSLLAARYRDEVGAWEVWDGPNDQPNFAFRSGAGAQAYAALWQVAQDVLRVASPGRPVIGGGSFATGPETAFWCKQVAARMQGGVDGWSLRHHPVTPASSPIFENTSLQTPRWILCGGYEAAGAMGAFDPADFSSWAGERRAVEDGVTYGDIWPYALRNVRDAARWQVAQVLQEVQNGDGHRVVILRPGLEEYYPAYNASDGAPSLRGVAVATLAAAFRGSRSVARVAVTGTQQVCAMLVQREGRASVLILSDWQAKGQVRLSLPDTVQVSTVWDWLGNPLSLARADDVPGRRNLIVPLTGTPVYVFFPEGTAVSEPVVQTVWAP